MATIIALNGTSSSGKTTLARAIQDAAPTLFLNFSIDNILYALPRSSIARMIAGEPLVGVEYRELVAAYYACVAQLARLGRDVIIDNAVTTEWQAELMAKAVEGHRVLTVLVTAPAPVLAERERARGDRRVGLAEQQLARIEQWLRHDLRIDTSVTSAEEGARAIVAAVGTPS